MKMQGVYTALVTPFDNNGDVDFVRFKELIKMQITAGVDGIIPVGTTGESPTLTTKEHIKVVRTAVEAAAGKCPIIAGTGANSTAEALELTVLAKEAGADASLQVAPYYNKPTQEGLYRHFSEVANKAGLPIVLYNVPGRSGVSIAPETIARLSSNANVIAVKEAGGSVERVSSILELCDITILSGDDSLTVPMISLGAVGVISVASNIIPAEIKRMVDAANCGDFKTAAALHKKYYCIFRDLFIESNPIPVKAAMALKGWIEEVYRLPLCVISDKGREQLTASLKKCGFI
ncbi:MAG: 4-hydroxy-tetrahydrodipicolinate synthase [Victivallaceae bacterium]|nr:4-hydroxy-tetrahydrodipicolinate synthase [Victivallaceae bacterium]MDD4180341.1 4-hydroxy-tetrahydrodipicolinate synthase [Victivallaceae bacterium]